MNRGPRLRQPSSVPTPEHPAPRSRGEHVRGPWLNTSQAAALAGRPTRAAFRKWARRARLIGIVPKGSRLLMFDKADVEAAMREAG